MRPPEPVSPAGRLLADLAGALALPAVEPSSALAGAGDRGRRRRAVRRLVAAALAVAVVVTAAQVHRARVGPVAAPAAGAAALTALVQRAVSESSPDPVVLHWDRVRSGAAARVAGVPAVDRPSSVVSDTAGVVPLARRGGQRAVLAYRVTVRSRGATPADPCAAAGPLPVRGSTTAQSGCDVRRVLNTPDGVVVRAASRVLSGPDAADTEPPRLEQVREVVLVVGTTTYSVAQRWRTADPAAADALVAPLSDAQLSLAVRYVATARRHGGPGVATTRLVARATLASALAAADPELYPPDWTAPGSASAASAQRGLLGRPLVDVRETTALQGAGVAPGTEIGYRVVRSANSIQGAMSTCTLAAVVPAGAGCQLSPFAELLSSAQEFAVTERSGPGAAVRQVLLVLDDDAPDRWVAVAVTAPVSARGTAALPLTTDQLLELAEALGTAGPP